MRRNLSNKLLFIAQLTFCWLCIGCSSDYIQVEAPIQKGVLCLRMSSDDGYINIDTRAVQPLTDLSGYTFTIDNGNGPVPVNFVDGEVIMEAGTYTLAATNADAVNGGYSAPLYSGDTKFTLYPGERKEVTLDLGTPKNSKVTVTFDSSFLDLYDLESLTLTDTKDKSDILSSTDDVAYFPVDVTSATNLTYTLVADAKSGSHVQDITSATGTISVETGKHTTITLKVNPIDPNLIIIETGADHSGEFE